MTMTTAPPTRRSLRQARGPAAGAGRTAARLLPDLVLTLACLAGLLVLGWLAFSTATGATIIVFQTGSMSPTMPAGTAAVSLPVEAAELRVGDVVTVRRDDASLPVTHRVVEIAEVPGDPASRELVLQGDANASPDLARYTVQTTLRVAAAVPGGGAVLDVVRSPTALAAMTLVATLLVLWTFWPRAHRQATPGERSR